MKKRLLNVLFALTVLIIGLFLFLKILDIIHFKCFFRYFFGIYCAGCGTTRMVKSILHLEFYKAFRYNPLMFILFVLSLLYMIYMATFYLKKGKVKLPSFKVIISLVILLLFYMLLRNVSLFEYLKPTII